MDNFAQKCSSETDAAARVRHLWRDKLSAAHCCWSHLRCPGSEHNIIVPHAGSSPTCWVHGAQEAHCIDNSSELQPDTTFHRLNIMPSVHAKYHISSWMLNKLSEVDWKFSVPSPKFSHLDSWNSFSETAFLHKNAADSFLQAKINIY